MKFVEIVYRYETAELAARERPASPAAAIARLDRGNVDFAALINQLAQSASGVARQVVHVDPRELGVRTGGDAPPQRPFAAVLGCADARVPIELVFHEGPNDLFVVRVAGNMLGPDILGSLRYAIDNLGGSLRLMVVLGHSGCGAIGAAVDTFLAPGGYLELAARHDLRGIVDGLLVTVLGAARMLEAVHGAKAVARPGYRAALVELAVLANAALGAHALRHELQSERASEQLTAVFGVYDIASRRIWGPSAADGERLGLAAPPADLAEFRTLGVAAAGSARIRALLEG